MPKRKNPDNLSYPALKGMPCSNEYRYTALDHAIAAFKKACLCGGPVFGCPDCVLKDKPCRTQTSLMCFQEWARLTTPVLLAPLTRRSIQAKRKEVLRNRSVRLKAAAENHARITKRLKRYEPEDRKALRLLDKLEAALKKRETSSAE